MNTNDAPDFEVLVWKKKCALTAGGTIEILPNASRGGVLEIVVRPRSGPGAPFHIVVHQKGAELISSALEAQIRSERRQTNLADQNVLKELDALLERRSNK
jgi:hypothetical protein